MADARRAPVDADAVAANVAALRRRIADAADGRVVELIAVTKGFGPDAIVAATRAGCAAIGESYAQELRAKADELDALGPRRWSTHFIGRLQTNKVRSIASLVDVWHTVDRRALVDEIATRAPSARVFVQLNATGETTKGGCSPEDAPGLVDAARQRGLVVEGLMTIGPTSGDPVGTAAAFTETRRLADDLGLVGCSMGMSGDLELAVRHGATHVRVGSALFGARPHHRDAIR